MRSCLCCWVSGRVQGVWFRGTTQQQAEALGISGYARNMPDGRVEVVACGEEVAVKSLQQWLWQGPKMAQVESVQCEPLALEEIAQGFEIKR